MKEEDKVLFGFREAADYLGLTVNELKNEVNFRKSIKPAKKRVDIFVREQLEDWRENEGHTSIEADGELFDTAEAAEYLGVTVNALGQLRYRGKIDGTPVPGLPLAARTIIYHKGDLDEYISSIREPIENSVALIDTVPKTVKEEAQAKLEREGGSLYGLVAQLWQEWLDGKRMVDRLDLTAYRRLPKEMLFARVEESLKESVDAKCSKLNLLRSHVTAQLLAQWINE